MLEFKLIGKQVEKIEILIQNFLKLKRIFKPNTNKKSPTNVNKLTAEQIFHRYSLIEKKIVSKYKRSLEDQT